SLTVRVGRVVVGIEDLDLVTASQVDAAVATLLPGARYFSRRRPLQVQLAVAEFAARRDVPGPVDRHHTVLDAPLGRALGRALPLGEVGSIEQNDGVRGRWSGIDGPRLLRGLLARRRRQPRHREREAAGKAHLRPATPRAPRA